MLSHISSAAADEMWGTRIYAELGRRVGVRAFLP